MDLASLDCSGAQSSYAPRAATVDGLLLLLVPGDLSLLVRSSCSSVPKIVLVAVSIGCATTELVGNKLGAVISAGAGGFLGKVVEGCFDGID